MTTVNRATTGIGSLPHHNVDAALEYSFRLGIPFLPQIPLRNPWEYMIAQALDGLPGLQAETDGTVKLNSEIWKSHASEFGEKLDLAFRSTRPDAFEAFEPTASTSSSWLPFLWELRERKIKRAKIQIAGPMTCQWVLKLKDDSPLESHTELAGQIYKLVLAKSLAMTRKLRQEGISPILYLDEPALYGFTRSNPKHLLGIQELKILIQTLKKENVQVGLHCCSNTDWSSVLDLGLNILSFDTALSLDHLLDDKHRGNVEKFMQAGGKLSLGVVPTSRSSAYGLHALDVKDLFSELLDALAMHWESRPDLVQKLLTEAIFTPACGLALHSPQDAEFILETLNGFYDHVSAFLLDQTHGHG